MVDDSETEIRALKTADEMTGGDDTVKSMLAEALSRAAGGQITVPARELIASVLARSPTEPRALYLAGLAAYQDGEYANTEIGSIDLTRHRIVGSAVGLRERGWYRYTWGFHTSINSSKFISFLQASA